MRNRVVTAAPECWPQQVRGQVAPGLNSQDAVLDPPGQRVGPFVDGLIGDAQCLSGGTDGAAEEIDRFSSGQWLHSRDLTIVKHHSSNRPCEHATVVANTYSARLELALTGAKKSISDLAAAMGISYQAVRKAVRGESNAFTAENNAKAARYLKVRANWLATGELPMHEAAESQPEALDQQAIRAALRTLRNQLAHGYGPHNEIAGAALALLAKVPDSDRAYEDAVTAMLAIAALPAGDPARAAFGENLSSRASTLANRFDALGSGPLQARAYAQMLQVLESCEEEKASGQKQPTAAPPSGQSPLPADAR